MNYKIYLNLKKMNRHDADAIAEYTKRLSVYCSTQLFCKPSVDVQRICGHPSEHTRYFLITPGYDTPSSEAFASMLDNLGIHGCSCICFFLGYPQPEVDIPTLSLSSMPLSTGLSGVVLCEQLYRSYRILNHQPYHK